MRREVTYLSVIAAAAPLAVSAPPQHATEITIAGGQGSYAVVTRGCEGNVITKSRVNYDNAAVEVTHKFPSVFRIGARAGILDLEGSSDATRYVNPYLSADWPGFSIGVGWVFGNHPFPESDGDSTGGSVSAHFRIGKAKKYFTLSYFEDVPLLTPGYLTAGFGGGGRKLHLWFGVGAIPYDNFGFVSRIDYRVAGGLSLGGTGRLGGSESINEHAFALRLSYLWNHGGETAPRDSSGKF
jgi:hypothetical protein